MKKLMILSGALAALAVCADEVPEVSGVTMTQGGSRLVTITYTLAKAPAVVTLDIQTNATDGAWASIGGANIQNVSGDVWKKVETGAHTISWRPDLSWPDHKIENGGARAVVTAWSVDNPPDYMVVNLAANATANSETYYPAVEFLPGGLLSNDIYRTSQLVMRKIPAQGVIWEMGSRYNETGRVSANEMMHTVTLDDNYYIAVFEITQSQWALVQTANQTPSDRKGDLRPVERVCYNEIRNAANSSTADTTCDYPAVPNSGSFLGLLRAKTGLLFDLPSEAQWEFACRAGHGSGYLGDGSTISDANVALLGRLKANGGDTAATANVGSFAPNSWGLYDMHGNVWEWCLDWYAADITGLGGAVNVTAGTTRVLRGGCCYNGGGDLRAARRYNETPTKRYGGYGFRVALPASPARKLE